MGFKIELFVEKVDENFKCSICLEVLDDPWQCREGHTFCKDCITQCLKFKSICPVGNNLLQTNSLSRCLVINNVIGNLKVYCKNGGKTETGAEIDCDWTGQLKTLEKHRRTCPFQQVECPNVGCNTKMPRRELKHHDKICQYKKIECDERCGVTLIRQGLKNHKKNSCAEVLLPCPNGCRTRIRRRLINLHLQTCPFQQVQCPNVSCVAMIQRRELDDHDKICEHKKVQCEKCRKTLTRHYLDLHADMECPEELRPCPNKCRQPETGQTSRIKRGELHQHVMNACPKTVLDCPFKDQGCSAQVERQHVDKHVQENTAAHMMLLAKRCSKLTLQNASLTEQCVNIAKQNTQLLEQYSTLELECLALKMTCATLRKEYCTQKPNIEKKKPFFNFF